MFEPLFALPLTLLSLTQPIPQRISVKIFPHLHDYAPEGIDTDPSHVTVQSPAGCRIYGGQSSSAASSGVLKSSVASLDLSLSAASLAQPIWIECSANIVVLRGPGKASYAYSGPLYAHATATGPELIEVKPLNDYLKGVVPSEMPAAWPTEALRAQAIAARTYAIFHMQLEHELADHPLYDVDDTVLYQAYTGETDRAAASDQAVDATGSTLITYQNQVIQAYFSADAGGYTEEADHVWPVFAPYCQSKPERFQDPGLDDGRWGPWKVKLPVSELNARLEAAGLIPVSNPVVLIWIDPANVYVSGRAKEVSVRLVDGTVTELDGLAFQHALGLRSILITLGMDPSSRSIEIDGKGFGHGVGMSQFGARLAALNGWSHSEILNFYYTGVRLCSVSSAGDLSCPAPLSRLQ